jgi:deoxyribodipyrimidine photo-lyase
MEASLFPTRPVIVWFRDDLRLADNPALSTAAASGRPLLAVFVHDEKTEGLRPLGGAALWWLHGALEALSDGLAARGGRLFFFRGPAADLIERLAVDSRAAAIYWNRRYDEAGQLVDKKLEAALRQRGLVVESFNGHLLHEPWTMAKQGKPFRVFSAFWRAACRLGAPPRPIPAPQTLSFSVLPQALGARVVALADLALEPKSPDWAGGLRATWQRGEPGAQACLERFLTGGLPGYATNRDRPDKPNTSRLSPYLRFGNISVRQVWHAAMAAMVSRDSGIGEQDLEKFLSELGWREFSYHLLHHHPDLARRNLRARFDFTPWRMDPVALRAWQHGQTGYPFVDAGMRELWTTGWVHNRVRMIVASFLVKHLLIDWRQGEAWFWDTLVDADPANNAVNWQWVAGSGADAAPYFRIFNPVLQGERFDPDGVYVKRWVPELSGLPSSLVHRPWAATPAQLAAAGVRLGETYPNRIIEHDEARRRALAALKRPTAS